MAVVNRFTRISPSRFTPRTAEEIMSIPLAKQGQHDAFSEGLSKLNEFDFSRLSGDDELSVQELADYRGKVDETVDTLAAKGVGPVNRQKILDLDRELKRNMSSSGKWGRRVANQQAAAAYVKEMHTKDARGDWSQEAADRYVQMQLQGFKTENEDGTFNSFQGQYLPTYVDKVKTVDNILKTIGEDTTFSPEMKKVLSNGYESFFESTAFTGKQKNKILATLAGAMLSDKNFRASYNMENMLSNNPEDNPFDIGAFDEETGRFNPNSQLGAYLESRAIGAASSKASITKYKLTDSIGLYEAKQRTNKFLERNINGDVNINTTILQETNPEDFTGIVEEIEDSKEILDSQAKYLLDFEKNNGDTNSNAYKNAKINYNISKNELQNLEIKLQDAKSKAIENLSPEMKADYEALISEKDVITEDYDFIHKGDFNLKDINRQPKEDIFAADPIAPGYLDAIKTQIDKDAIKILKEEGASQNIAVQSIGTSGTASGKKNSVFSKEVDEVLGSLELSNFDAAEWSMSDGSGLLIDNYEDINIPLNDTYSRGEIDPSNTKVDLLLTPDSRGDAQFKLAFRNKDGVLIDHVLVTKGKAGNSMANRISDALQYAGSQTSRDIGEQLKYNKIAPELTEAGLYTNAKNRSKTVIPRLQFNGKDITWEKKTTNLGTYFTVTMDGIDSPELTTPADVSRYITLVGDMYGSNGVPVQAGVDKFEATFPGQLENIIK